MSQHPADRGAAIDRLYEDVRRAMNDRDFAKAARLSVALAGELADDDFIRTRMYPICLECNGYAEVVDPEHPEKKAMCVSAPKVCPGNRHGRMEPVQYQAYLDAKLAPRQPTITERVPSAGADGTVPKLPPDMQRPTPPAPAAVYSREQVIALNRVRAEQGLEALPLPPLSEEEIRALPGSAGVAQPEPEKREAQIIQS